MPLRSLQWRLFPWMALVALSSVLLAGWIAIRELEQSWLEMTRRDLAAAASFFDRQLGAELPAAGTPRARTRFTALAGSYQSDMQVRVALLRPDGGVEYDSEHRAKEFEKLSAAGEIRAALAGRAQETVRYSTSRECRMRYLAAPIEREGEVGGVLYLSTSLAALDETIDRAQHQLMLAAAALMVLALLAARLAAKIAARPLEQVRHGIERVIEGDWSVRVYVDESREFLELGDAFNRMAAALQRKVGVLVQSNNEQQAVLASMDEGVLAVDRHERVISMNQASARLLGLSTNHGEGRRLREVVRNADLSRFVGRALTGLESLEDEILLHGDRTRVMQARSSALRDSQGQVIGAVVVLNDVTDFRRLEDIRRDFVANVSHELKTPITSIKGFVETLLDGALSDPADAERFLRIVAKQADRLHAIIEDLLSLSKIEQSEDTHDIELLPTPLRGVLDSALANCQAVASDRTISIVLECDSQLQVQANPLLLEQAVVNLLDNAIKYSEPGKDVQVRAAASGNEIAIRVTDHGCGIAGEHLARIFERFYRVDPARSRKLGGTGLGLAIVKHIVQAHHGRVSVESHLGRGSTFTIFLPKG